MRPLFITATNTGVGKTHVTLALLKLLRTYGVRALPFKPIETGACPLPEDARALLGACADSTLTLEQINPYRFSLPASPFVAGNGALIEDFVLLEAFAVLQARCDVVLIEGAGGLMVPIDSSRFMIDLISLFDAHALLVTPANLGCINDTLLSLEALKGRGIPHHWCVNLRPLEEDSFGRITLPYYTHRFGEIHLLPRDLERLVHSLLSAI